MGQLIASMDWSSTPVGPIEEWPESLRATLRLVLMSNWPMAIAWGPECTQFYNDRYRLFCGEKHPGSMGQDFRECWREAWPAVGDDFDQASRGGATFSTNARMFLDRHGFLEEVFFTFSFSPIRDENGEVAGVFNAGTEVTAQSLSTRRLETVHAVTAATTQAPDEERCLVQVAEALARYPEDIPFAALYRGSKTERHADCAAATGAHPALPPSLSLDEESTEAWPLARVARTGETAHVDLREASWTLTATPFGHPVRDAFVLPLTLASETTPEAFAVIGLSPHSAADEPSRAFLEMLTACIGHGLTAARYREEERQRGESLQTLQRLSTAFLSNVSHELRTPLTLMLGPLERWISASHGHPGAEDAAQPLHLVYRNARRLLRLVDSLLTFAHMEESLARARFQPTDLARLTSELASAFSTTAERVGLELTIDCPPLPEPAWVDRTMWETIVLNLLTNAFKYTLEGRIEVSLCSVGDSIELSVRDTGVGIPRAQQRYLFQRFTQMGADESRNQEGSGIGLALVRELARAHGGDAWVRSSPSKGSTFVVAVRRGRAHLPHDTPYEPGANPLPTAPRSELSTYLDEVRSWFDSRPLSPPTGSPSRTAGRVLLADDNPDMRTYIGGLLADAGFQVSTAADGEEALAAAREDPPDLLLTDVMMPCLDGLDLVRALREDAKTATLPIIVVSAHANEAARVEGLASGADDYVAKPFSAPELLARVAAQIAMARVREFEFRRRERSAKTAPLAAAAPSPNNPNGGDTKKGRSPMRRMAHDFNNVLTALTIHAEMLRAGLPPDHPAQRELQGIDVAIERGHEMIQRSQRRANPRADSGDAPTRSQ